MRGSRPPLAMPPSCFISFRISSNCLTSWFTSETVVPDPLRVALAPGAVEGARVGALAPRHGRDERLDLPQLPLGLRARGQLRRELAHPGDHLEKVSERAHALDLLELAVEVLEREARLEELLGLPLGVAPAR